MERRALIAVVISLVILIVYQEVVIKRLYPPIPAPPVEEAPPSPVAEPARPAPPAEAPVAPPPPAALAEGRDIVIDTELYRAVFTTAGARLKSLQLKRYRTAVQPDSPPLELVLKSPVEDFPLGVELRGAQTVSDRNVAYQVDRERIEIAGSRTTEITFRGELAGVSISKRVTASGDRYLFGVDVAVQAPPPRFSELALSWHEGIAARGTPAHEVIFDTVVTLQGTKLRRESFDKLAAGSLLESNIAWVAFSGPYFLAAMVPRAEPENPLRVFMKSREHAVMTQVLLPAGQFTGHFDLYLGPKDVDILEEAGHSLRRAVDLGWFTFVALPLLHALRFSNRLTHNYGIDIILLTVVIKILFIPLTQKSLKSMREMQKLQPQMAAIRERYKDKPEEMNREIMELYRRHKVNPFGGCLPMVLQIPVFIGLYQALANAVELRHAGFAGWINDLSAPDRLGSIQLPFVHQPGFPVLTLLMGASMFVQQWMTPTTADPSQQRVMLIMPVLFTFMFINFPSGLTLYWLVNNILTIAQQYAMNRPGRDTRNQR